MMKKIGAAGAIGSGLSTTAAATNGSDDTPFEFETEELDESTVQEEFEGALSSEPGQAIAAFLREEKQASIATDAPTGHRVSPNGQLPEHTVVRAPITSTASDNGSLWFYVFGENVTASATIDGDGYRSNQTIIDEFDQDVISVVEWQKQNPSQRDGMNAQLSPGVDGCETVPLRNVCEYLRDIKEISPVTVTIEFRGERYTVGDVVVGYTGCSLLDILEEDSPDGCSVNTVDICVKWKINSVGFDEIDYEASVEIIPCN